MASSHLTIGSGDRHVMALHGWFGSARGWGSLPEYLDGSAFTYVFPDLRGYGGRRDVTGEFTMAEAAADALSPTFIDHVVQHSLDNSTVRPSGRTWSRGPGRISPAACRAIRSRSRSSSGSTTRPCRRR